jgi:enamine deaminase RidA (YjgF/YER057c/UK114 family)
MAISLINPDGHVKVPQYHHVAVATGGKQVHIAGQVSWDADGNLVAPGDLTGQVAQVFRNVAKSLDAAGASFQDVVRFTWYVVDWQKENFGRPRAGSARIRPHHATGHPHRRRRPLRRQLPRRSRGHRRHRLTV